MAELKLSEALEDNEKKRFDSGYFLKEMLETEKQIRSYPQGFDELGDIFSRFSKGIFDINASYYTESGVPFLRIGNLSKYFISEGDDLAYIPEEIHLQEAKTEILKGDIVISKTAYPAVAISYLERANTSQDTIATGLSKYGKDNYISEFVVVYLNSYFGKLLSLRQFQGNIQMHLGLDDGRKIPIIRASLKFQEKIRALVLEAYAVAEKSKTNLQQAETLLLSALGLEQWQPPEALTYERSASEVFGAGRLDAQFFQSKYADLAERLEATGKAARLGDLLSRNERGKQPIYAEFGMPVVNSKHVMGGQVNITDDNRFGEESTGVTIQNGDVVINGTGVGTIGRAAPYFREADALPDNHVTVLRPKLEAIDPIYLSVFLNSRLGQMQVDQRLRGSSGQIELYPADIAEFIIWDAPKETQDQIRQAVVDSFEAKRTSSHLLETAKRAVEMAIEESEAAALEYLSRVVENAQ